MRMQEEADMSRMRRSAGGAGPGFQAARTAPRRAHEPFPRARQGGSSFGRLLRRGSGDRRQEPFPRRGLGSRWLVSAGLLALLVFHAAHADLVGRSETSAIVADAAERALIEANPILERIARERPEALREILDRLRAPEPPQRRSAERLDDAEDPNGAPGGILAKNPDIADYYRKSPEAALDLLRLIREATKER